MRTVNKFLSSFWAVTLTSSLLIFSSCKDESLDKFSHLNKSGAFVRFEKNNPPTAVGVDKISELKYEFSLIDANKNVASYTLKMHATLSGIKQDTVELFTINKFPHKVSYTGSELANFLGKNESDISFGDQFYFIGSAINDDGILYSTERLSFDNKDDEDSKTYEIKGGGLSGDLFAEEGYKQAYEFNFIILCPSAEASKLVGEFTVENHRFDAFFGNQGETRTIIAGPGENQITIKGGALPLDGADDLVLNIDPTTSKISYGGASGKIHFNTFGPGSYGSVSGLAFSCIGVIDITINSDGFIPNFLKLKKK